MGEAEPRRYSDPALPASRASFARLRRLATHIPTYVANAIDNPERLVMFTLGRVMPVRQAYRKLRAGPPPAVPVAGPTIFGKLDPTAVADAIRTDGIYPGLTLPGDAVRAIGEFAVSTPCFGNRDRRLEFWARDHLGAEERFGRPLLTGQYFDRIEASPAIAAVRRDALLHAVATAYLGPRARVAATRLWWSFPARPQACRDRFHFDLDDWQTLKFFFYLTPVDRDAGPHVYIRGSHRQRRWRHQLTLLAGQPTGEVVAAYGAQNILSVTGGAGFGFAEDPFGFHMGVAPRLKPRLMLEIAFGVSTASKRRFYGEPVVAPA